MFVYTELDALGDELLLDEDSSYLDEATSHPSIPEGVPGEKSINRVLLIFFPLMDHMCVCVCMLKIAVFPVNLSVIVTVFQDGVLVVEFGLPHIPVTSEPTERKSVV